MRLKAEEKPLTKFGRAVALTSLALLSVLPVRATVALANDSAGSTLDATTRLLDLEVGDRGTAVEFLQILLKRLGHGSGDAIDGVYGRDTAALVTAFQAEQGLPTSGQVSPRTWSVLWAAPWQDLAVTGPIMVDTSPIIDPNQSPPPSPLWLVSMPAIPLLGGMFTYWKRRLLKTPTIAPSPSLPSDAYFPMTSNLVRYFPLIGLTVVSLAAFGSYVTLRSQLSPPVLAALSEVADNQSSQLDDWFDQQRQAVLEAATASEILPQIELLLTNRDTQAVEYLKAYTIFSAYLETLEGFGETKPEISLLTNGGIVVFSTDTQREGQYQPIQNTTTYFTRDRADQVPNLYVSPINQALQITFATPVLNETEQRLGVLAIDLDLGNLDQRIREFPPLADLPEIAAIASRTSYTVGRASLVKNEIIQGHSDTDPEAPHSDEGVSSRGIDRAMDGISGKGLYLNYDKVPVLGVYRWASRHNLALLVEVDQAEVFKPARRVARDILAVGFTLTALISLALSRRPPAALASRLTPSANEPDVPDVPPGVPDQQ
jgi:peptidoglycan hydrolase-like protein with peptidoglycan-binding domain